MLIHRNPFDNSKDSVIKAARWDICQKKSGEPYISGIDGNEEVLS